MRAENQYRADRNLLDGFDENSAAPPQLVHDIAVMDDFVMNIDRIPVRFECEFDNVYGSHDARAKPARPDAYQRLGAVIGSMDSSQRQCNLRKALSFYLKLRFAATSFAFLVLPPMQPTAAGL